MLRKIKKQIEELERLAKSYNYWDESSMRWTLGKIGARCKELIEELKGN